MLQSGFTFSDTESILAPSSCFVSHWMQPFQILSLVPLLSSPPLLHLPLFWQKKNKKMLVFLHFVWNFHTVKPWQRAFPFAHKPGRRRTRLPVRCPLDGQHTIVVLHKQLLVFLREARAHLTALRPCLFQKSVDALKASRNTCLTS